ncbi:MAG: uroporphyrinogen decarboxylase family protein [Clostridia bacterium]
MEAQSASRKRVFDAFEFRKPDKVPVEHHPSTRGYFDYGEKMRDLFKKYPADFGDVSDVAIPVIPDGAYDRDGRYSEERMDDWGILWAYRIFQIQGHPIRRPLDDISMLDTYRLPPVPYSDPGFKALIAREKEKYFTMRGMFTLFERMTALRLFEDVLMDMYTDDPGINRLADMITDYYLGAIDNLLDAGVDCVAFGDDFGTQSGLLISPEIFRNFLRPRYQRMIDRVKAAGKKVHFHSCGANMELLDDIAGMGIDSYWPQLTAYKPKELAAFLKERKIAIALHFRGAIMNFGTPEEIKRKVRETAEIFDFQNGGGWFYIEVDDGFPYENTRALFEAVDEIR